MYSDNEKVVLCGASAYEQKYYFNQDFASLPQSVQDELHIMCVMFTVEIGGIFTMWFDSDGSLQFETEAIDADAMYDEIGGAGLLGELRKFDPERAAKLHPADKKRIVRAMEVYILTGKTITQHDAETRAVPPRYDAAKIALDFAIRQDLYDRIDRRVDIMVQQGLFDEVRALLAAGVPADCTAMQAIGYKEAVAAVQGKAAPQDAVAAIQLASRRYAKRQLTWLRRDQDLFWLRHEKTPDMDRACRLSTQFLSARGIE